MSLTKRSHPEYFILFDIDELKVNLTKCYLDVSRYKKIDRPISINVEADILEKNLFVDRRIGSTS